MPLFWETIHKIALKTIKSKGEKTLKKFEKGLKIYNTLSNSAVLANKFSKIAFKQVRENLFGESVMFLISGGGGISKQTLQFFNAIGYRLVNGYGTTEKSQKRYYRVLWVLLLNLLNIKFQSRVNFL